MLKTLEYFAKKLKRTLEICSWRSCSGKYVWQIRIAPFEAVGITFARAGAKLLKKLNKKKEVKENE